MTTLTRELSLLHSRILETGSGTRHLLQPKLAELIAHMDAAGEPVPAGIRDLSEELTIEAIEAQFDNMPV